MLPSTSSLLASCLLVAASIVLPFPAAAQVAGALKPAATEKSAPQATAEAKTPDVEELRKQRAALLGEIDRLDKSPGRRGDAPEGTPESELTDRTRLLRFLAFLYQQQINATNEIAEQQRRIEQLKTSKPYEEVTPGSPGTSVLRLDNLRAELQNLLLVRLSVEAQLKIIDGQNDATQTRLTKAQARERQSLETLEKVGSARNKWIYQLAALDSRVEATLIDRLALERNALLMRRNAIDLELEQSRQRLKAAEAHATFSDADLHSIRIKLAEHRAALIKQLDQQSALRDTANQNVARLRSHLNVLGKRIEELRGGLERAGQDLAAAESALKAEEEKSAALLQKINPARILARSQAGETVKRAREQVAAATRRLAASTTEKRTTEQDVKLAETQSDNAAAAEGMANTLLVGLDIQQTFWELRHSATGTGTGKDNAADIKKLYGNIGALLDKLAPLSQHLQSQFELTIDQINQLESAKLGVGDPAELKFLERMLGLLQERQQIYLQGLSRADELRQLLLRWQMEFESVARGRGTEERLQGWSRTALDWLSAAWDYELFAVEDTIDVDGRTITGKRSVTVAKTIQAIVIMVVGYLLVAKLSAWFFGLATRRLGMDPTHASIAQKWVVAISAAILLLISLAVVKIPLTVFAFLGGAIAIGAGFGMQTLLKNLISGLMLLIERPFRPGDIIEVGGIRGDIVDVNVRSCTIRDADGIETLVPNSTFIEQNVTNWTLSSRMVRFCIKVGVAYGTPLQDAIDLMHGIAENHLRVLETPPPEVLLEDFGDNAQVLSLYIWLEVSPRLPPPRRTLSELRLSIAKAFAENKLVMAFPQRDVHLDAAQAIKVEVVHAGQQAPA